MNISTQHHGDTCAVEGCPSARDEAYEDGRAWVQVDGHVWSDDRRTWVVGQWSRCCPEHAAEVVDAIAAALENHPQFQPLPWRVETWTLDYGTHESTRTIERDGNGKAQPDAPVQGTLF